MVPPVGCWTRPRNALKMQAGTSEALCFFGATDQFGEGLYDFVNLHRQAAGRESDLAKLTEQLETLIDPEKIIAPSLERLSQARSHWVPEGLSERLANLQKQFPGATIDEPDSSLFPRRPKRLWKSTVSFGSKP